MLILAHQVSSLVHGDVLAGWLGMISWTRLVCSALPSTIFHRAAAPG